jgi:hypothetical protein
MRCTRITYNHLIVRFETLEGNVLDAMGFMLRFGFGDDGGAGDEGVVDSWIGDQVCLEFSEVDVQRSFEAEGRGDGGHHLKSQYLPERKE